MVKVTDCTCCDCDSAQERETIKERALSSINKVYTFDNRTFWPDGTGMVTLPLPTQEQLNVLDDVTALEDQVEKNTRDIGTNAELIAGEQTQIDSLKTTLETSYQAIVQKGSANGYAGLDNNARVPLAQLYAGTSANQVPLIGKQLLANEMLVVDADGLTVRSKPIVQTLSFRGIYPAKSALPSEGNVSGDYAIVSDGTAQDDTGYYVWGYNTATSEYEWVWTILFDANSYQLISNLVTTIDSSSDDSHYPSAKAVKDYYDASVGTLEQEITDINNDMAELQTTVNGHTASIATQAEEITAVNTLANRAYDDVEIADSVMTFTRGNGGTTQIEIPTSGLNMIHIIPPYSIDPSRYTLGALSSSTAYNINLDSPTLKTIVYDGQYFLVDYYLNFGDGTSTFTSTQGRVLNATQIKALCEEIIEHIKSYADISKYKSIYYGKFTINFYIAMSQYGSDAHTYQNTAYRIEYDLNTETITSYPTAVTLRADSNRSSTIDSIVVLFIGMYIY